MQYILGVDIGGTTVKMGLFEETGKLLEKWEIQTRTKEKGKFILSDVAESLTGVLRARAIDTASVIGIGCGVPAPVSKTGYVEKSANLGWEDYEAGETLHRLTGLKVSIGNDANVAALGEMWQGGGKGYKDLIVMTLGTGVGGGIIVDGGCVTGAHGSGGEIGHITVNPHETRACGCGRKGCLEQYASATGIAHMADQKMQKETRKTVLKPHGNTAKDVFDAVKQGDVVAKEVAESFGKALGKAAANLAVVTDPEVFVIGGGVSKAGPVLLDYVEKAFQENAFYGNRNTKFVLATLGNDAGITGAARLVLK